MIRDILEDCAETAVASFFALLDGVGGSYGGIFEIVAVDSANQRNLLNPQNTERSVRPGFRGPANYSVVEEF
jgi:hypothetical protein